MGTKILFHSDNSIDSAVLTPLNEDANFPIENLQNEQRSVPYRSTSASSGWIKITHPVGTPADTLIILDHNLPVGTTIGLDRDDTDPFTTPTFSESVTWNAGPIIHRFTQNTFAFSLIFISLPGAQVIEIGRVILGVSKTTARNFLRGFRKRKIDYTDNVLSTGKQSFANLMPKIREWDIVFLSSDADRDILEALFDEVGIGKHLAISFFHDTKPNTELYYGKLISQLEYAGRAPNLHEFSVIAFREST